MEKDRQAKKKGILNKRNKKFLFFSLLILILFLKEKQFFFICLFIILNWLILYMKFGFGIDSPIEVITFGTFMTSYVYGTPKGILVAASSLFAIAVTGRFKLDKVIINLILFFIAFIAPYMRPMDVAVAGILALIIRYGLDFLINLTFFNDGSFFVKIPERTINLIFWIIVYTSFGSGILYLMKI